MFSLQDRSFVCIFISFLTSSRNALLKGVSFVNCAWTAVIWNLYPDLCLPFAVAARFKRLGTEAVLVMGLRVRIPPRHECLYLVKVVCRQEEVSASDRSPAQRSATECGVSEYDHEASIMRRSLTQ